MNDHYVYGIHAVTALLKNPHRKNKKLYINPQRSNKRLNDLVELAATLNVPMEKLASQLGTQSFAEIAHQGVVAWADPLPHYEEQHIDKLIEIAEKPLLLLILDGITDAHNLGACLRTADGAGVDFIVIPKDKNATITPVVTKVACGAVESVPLIRVTNLIRAMERIKQAGVWIYGAAVEASHTVCELDCTISIALALGAEDTGLRRLTREHCDGLFTIPMLGSVESLNVSVATGISLYEAVRQRKGAF